MRQHITIRTSVADWPVVATFYLLLLQNPLSSRISLINYIDEGFALLGLVLLAYFSLRSGKLVLKRMDIPVILAGALFVAVGLLANLLYRYQGTKAILIDLLANVKFFLCIITGYQLFVFCGVRRTKQVLNVHARIMAVTFFALLLMDLVLHVFDSSGTRYGLRVVQLFYGHPTYLAGAAVFLLLILTACYDQKNNWYIFMSLAVLFFTLRGKAIAGSAIYIVIYHLVLSGHKKITLRHIAFIALVAIALAWDQFYFYYIELADESARSALTKTSVRIMLDYFPIGTGFGTFGSNVAAQYYSPVYYEYGLNVIYGLTKKRPSFASDTFWPIIIGQTGLVGTVCYVFVIYKLFMRSIRVRSKSMPAYAAAIFAFAYMLISSTSESAFCNPLAIPVAMILGLIFAVDEKTAAKVPPDK